MSWPSLAGVLLLMSFAWLFVYGAPIHNELSVLRAADGYVEAELVVVDPHCVTSGSSRRASSTWCYLAGTIDGERAELSTGSSLPPAHPAGSRIRVLFNPSMPGVGWNHQSLQVVRWEADLAAASRRRVSQMAGLVALSLFITVCVNIALRRAIRQRSRAPEGSFSADVGGGAPAAGVPLAGMGLTFLLGQLTGGPVALGGVVLGLLLAGGGAWLLRRRYLAAATHESSIVLGTHLLGITLRRETRDVPPGAAISLRGTRAPWMLSLGAQDRHEDLARTYDIASARRWGRSLADILGCAWRDEVTEKIADRAPAYILPTTETGRIGLLLFILIVMGAPWLAWRTWQDPAVRERAALSAAAPLGGVVAFDTMPGVRAWAARELGTRQTPSALLGLIRLLNTIDPDKEPEVGAAGIEALRGAAPAGAVGSGEWHEQLGSANRWVADRVGRTLDAHGGVLGWFPIAPEFRPAIEAIAGGDPYEAWSAWSGFGAGTLTTPEAFLFAVGSALGDSRPIPFRIRRTSAPGTPLRFEGQPEPRDDDALAGTVGDALALHLWRYDGIYSDSMSDDFRVWWSAYARGRLLPPMSPGR